MEVQRVDPFYEEVQLNAKAKNGVYSIPETVDEDNFLTFDVY